MRIYAGTSLALGLALTGLEVASLWLAYISLGGNHSLAETRKYIHGQTGWAPAQHDIAVQALNECCAALGLGWPIAYADEGATS